MKLKRKEREAVGQLRELDAQQRDIILARIERAARAQRVIAKAGKATGALKKVKGVADHKIVKAYGTVPPWRPKKRFG